MFQGLLVGILSFSNVCFYLLQFSASHIGHLTWSVDTLSEALHGVSACCLGQEFQLVKVFLGLRFVLLWGDKSDEHSRLGLGFGDDKFLHSVAIIDYRLQMYTLFLIYTRKRQTK